MVTVQHKKTTMLSGLKPVPRDAAKSTASAITAPAVPAAQSAASAAESTALAAKSTAPTVKFTAPVVPNSSKGCEDEDTVSSPDIND